MLPLHPILQQSFAVIDQEIGTHSFTAAEYAIVRRVIHSTADFEFKHLVHFSPGAIAAGVQAMRHRCPVVTDVSMVQQGIASLAASFGLRVVSAVAQVPTPLPGRTRTETGLLQVLETLPQAIYVIGNAPTALLALCDRIQAGMAQPALVIGVPVGFIAVVESKAALAALPVPQIRVAGRKGGSAVAAAIVNALIMLASEDWPVKTLTREENA